VNDDVVEGFGHKASLFHGKKIINKDVSEYLIFEGSPSGSFAYQMILGVLLACEDPSVEDPSSC
jgi:hypothetical protein